VFVLLEIVQKRGFDSGHCFDPADMLFQRFVTVSEVSAECLQRLDSFPFASVNNFPNLCAETIKLALFLFLYVGTILGH
jgi:hypothetical protein